MIYIILLFNTPTHNITLNIYVQLGRDKCHLNMAHVWFDDAIGPDWKVSTFQPTTSRWRYSTQIMITLFMTKLIRQASYLETFLLPQYPGKVHDLAKYLLPQ